MKIAVKNGLVVFASENIEFYNSKLKVDNIKVIDCDEKNTVIYDDVELPSDFIGGCYTYSKGVFKATEQLANVISQNEARETEKKKKSQREEIIANIAKLESQITQRRIREAMLGDTGFIKEIEAKIAIERGKM